MKTIRIFIGSSITELEVERFKLMSFIQGLNNKYHDQGIFIEGYICEETPNNMRPDGSQQMHNDYINNEADATIFMFFHKAGEFTLEELRLAREAFLQKDKPNVFIFFKAVDKAPDVTEEIQKAVSTVFNDYGHYYKMFEDVDTIKLELLQFLCDMLPGKAELVVKDGAVLVNGEAVQGISAANVFAYQNNPNLAKLKARMDELLKDMTAASMKGDATKALRISIELGNVQKEYHELEKNILDMLISFSKENRMGKKANPRRMEALRLLELGKYEEAKLLIPQAELDQRAESFSKKQELSEEKLMDEAAEIVEDARTRIQALIGDIENCSRFDEIERTYECAYGSAKAAKDYDFIFSYARFIWSQNDYPKAIAIAEKLHYIYSDPESRDSISDKAKSRLLNLLGMMYYDNNQPLNAENIYLEAKALFERILSEDKTPENEAGIALTCNNLANLYSDTGRPDEAEKLYLDALNIRQRLADTIKNEACESDAAATCNNLAILYRNTGRPIESENMYLEALKMRREIAKQNKNEEYESDVATTCNNLAILYLGTNRYQEAQMLFLEALEIRQRLVESVSRATYEPFLAQTYNSLAKLYKNTGRTDEAEELHQKALEIRRRLAATISKSAYEAKVAASCNNLAQLYADSRRASEAEELYLEALEIRRRLARTVIEDKYAPDIAATCKNLAALYVSSGRSADAEKLYLEALDVYRRIAKSISRSVYEPEVAETLYRLGINYKTIEMSDKCNICFVEAKKLAECYKDTNPTCQQIYEALS